MGPDCDQPPVTNYAPVSPLGWDACDYTVVTSTANFITLTTGDGWKCWTLFIILLIMIIGTLKSFYRSLSCWGYCFRPGLAMARAGSVQPSRFHRGWSWFFLKITAHSIGKGKPSLEDLDPRTPFSAIHSRERTIIIMEFQDINRDKKLLYTGTKYILWNFITYTRFYTQKSGDDRTRATLPSEKGAFCEDFTSWCMARSVGWTTINFRVANFTLRMVLTWISNIWGNPLR